MTDDSYEPEHRSNIQECDGYWIVVLDGEYDPAIDEVYQSEDLAILACDQADDLGPTGLSTLPGSSADDRPTKAIIRAVGATPAVCVGRPRP